MKMVEQLSVSPKIDISVVQAEFGSGLVFGQELASFTSYKTGGRAKYFIEVKSPEELSKAVSAARKLKLTYFLLGGGTNLLISDDGFDGVIIKLNILGISLLDKDTIDCGAGEDLMSLVNFATENSLTGMEFAAGIWGSVGGAIFGNAGAYGGEIGSVVSELTIIDTEGNLKVVTPEYCQFGYRDSYLKSSREIVVSATIKLKASQSSEIQGRVDEIISKRNLRHPNDGMSAGCFFKNIPDANEPHGKLPAGRLLEEIGAKGMSFGGAKVFENHANIIVNTGTATSRDIRDLADMLKKKVYEKFGITLEEEVQQIGSFA